MSFILDAIAKSEQERRQMQMPNSELLAIPKQVGRPARRWLPLFLIVTLLFNAIVMFIWIQSDKTANSEIDISASSSKQVRQSSVETMESNQSLQENSAQHTTQPEIKPISIAAIGTINRPQTSGTPEATVASTIKQESDGWMRIEPDTLANSAREGSSKSVDTDNTVEASQLVVSRLYDLPESVRDDLPTVKFAGHLYSSDPASSVVFLDNQRPVMQGQQIVDELILHEITPEGVVVKFRGYLIGVGVLQNWTLN